LLPGAITAAAAADTAAAKTELEGKVSELEAALEDAKAQEAELQESMTALGGSDDEVKAKVVELQGELDASQETMVHSGMRARGRVESSRCPLWGNEQCLRYRSEHFISQLGG